jgi:hypothetical protein
MKKPLRASSLACLAVCGLMLSAGCGDDVSSSVGGCDITTTVLFHGREYTEGGEVGGSSDRQVQKGRRLGIGEMAACPREERERVPVLKVIGAPVPRAVYVEPFGLMTRSHFDRE